MRRVPEAVCTFEIRPVRWNATPRVQEGLTATIVALGKAWVMTLKYLTLEAYLSKQWEPSVSRWQLFAPVSGVQPSILYVFCLHSGFAAFERRSGRLWWKTHTNSSQWKGNRRGFSKKEKKKSKYLTNGCGSWFKRMSSGVERRRLEQTSPPFVSRCFLQEGSRTSISSRRVPLSP